MNTGRKKILMKVIMDISIIIPVYNEENTISDAMEMLSGRSQADVRSCSLTGGSTDRTVSMISDEFRVISSLKGRANQMNQGAVSSSGKVLFFLHCDSILPDSNETTSIRMSWISCV